MAATDPSGRRTTNALGADLGRGGAAGQATCIGLSFLVEQLRREPPRVLGVTLAVLSAASFALNNAAARRAVVTGTPAQGMALTVPVGVLCFLLVAAVTGEIAHFRQFSATAVLWMSGVGVLNFVFGRYCNYKGNQSAGANLTGPVVQLNVVVTLALAVIVLDEPCSALQIAGAAVMLAATFITQRQGSGGSPISTATAASPFVPRIAEGYLFAFLAALAYGTAPVMTRIALQSGDPSSAIFGGVVAYGSATAVIVTMLLLSRALRGNVAAVRRDDVRWFVYSGVFVAIAQGFMYAAISVAPIMVVIPLLQLTLIFRLFFGKWLNPEHEVFGPRVIIGSVISILGACAVAIDTAVVVNVLHIPEGLASLLQWQI
jgi:drug/metabolite transporter (DMT)-like permease